MKHITPDLIDDVLLVGGSTSVPAIYQAMEAIFGKPKIRRNLDPMQCVAIGAGILAHRMQGIECPKCQQVCDEAAAACTSCGESLAAARAVVSGMNMSEFTNRHYGIQVVSGSDANRFKVLVESGTQLPMATPVTETFYTTEQGQRLIRIPVFEGLSHELKRNKPMGVIRFQLPVALAANHAVAVQFRVDRNATVTLRIRVEGHGFEHEQTVDRNLEEKASAHEGSDQDGLDKEEISERERKLALLDAYVRYTREFCVEYQELLTKLEKEKLSKAVEAAADVLARDDAGQAGKRIDELNMLLIRCGTASLIAQAVSVANQTVDEGQAAKLRADAAELKQSALQFDQAAVIRLSRPIAATIREIQENNEKKYRIYRGKASDGLLQTKGTGA
jgi:molecular chaperone DnaK